MEARVPYEAACQVDQHSLVGQAVSFFCALLAASCELSAGVTYVVAVGCILCGQFWITLWEWASTGIFLDDAISREYAGNDRQNHNSEDQDGAFLFAFEECRANFAPGFGYALDSAAVS